MFLLVLCHFNIILSLLQMADKHEFLRDFIEIYRTMPCLWRIKSADYSNRLKKKEAYQKLVELTKQHYPSEPADEASVKKRIQAIRTVYRKEVNKVENSTKSGAGSEDVYVPKLWYFELLSFTRDQEVPRKMASILAPDPLIQHDSPVGDDTEEAGISTPIITPEQHSFASTTQEEETETPSPSAPSASVPRQLTFSGRKRKAPTSETPQFIELAKKVLTTPQNLTGFAFYANEKLPTLDPVQRLHAERLMLQVLSEASMGKLTDTIAFMDRRQYPQNAWPQNPETPEPTMWREHPPNQGHVPAPYYLTPPRHRVNEKDPYFLQL
ncbi:uncharacterized protein [Dendrobates tinctorius]|uniref:uncharacterized protein n=1 Tax=Dendrobates tinctorius TaxID=92724 RepID=UPI003CC9BB70